MQANRLIALFLALCTLSLSHPLLAASVNIANGNLFDEQSISPLPKLPVTIAYNSKSERESVFGYGWNASFDIRLLINSDGSCVLMDSDGSEELFSPGPEGTFTAAADAHDSLEKQEDTYRLTRKSGGYVHFSNEGLPLEIADKNDNTLSLIYNEGKLTMLSGPNGEELAVSTDSEGRITALAAGEKTTGFTYDSNNNLTSITDPAGQTTSFSYDDAHNRTAKTDPAGKTSNYFYDDKDRVVSSVNSAGEERRIEYVSATVSRFIDPSGNATEFTFDENQKITQKKDALENITSTTWDEAGNKTSVTDVSGTVAMTYDEQGNMLSRTDQLDRTTSYSYNQYGQATSITDPQGDTTKFSYDANGNLLAMTDPTGSTTCYTYDDRGRLTAVTDATGQTTTLGYDAAGNLVKITDPIGAVMTMAYDAAGNMIAAADPAGVRTEYAYDALDRLVRVTDAAGNSTAYAYDALGNRTGTTDANGNATRMEYDHKGRVTKIIDALGQATSIAYAEAGCPSCGAADGDKPLSLTDANGNTTAFSYDALGRLVAETDPLGNVTRYGYDARGNLVSRTDAEGSTIAYAYDKLGRLTGKTYPDGTATIFAYDVKGRLIRAANEHIAYEMVYDVAGRLLSITDSEGRTVSYGHDALGNRVKMITPEGREVSYTYDEANRLARIGSWAGGFDFGYDLPGHRTSLAYPNGVVTSYAYDPLGNLTEILTRGGKSKKGGKGKKSDILSAFAYSHDKIGNRLTRTALDRHDHGTRHEYAYDPIYRLLEALPVKLQGKDKPQPNKAEIFAYDPVGNRLAGPKTKNTYIHNDGNQLLEGPKYSYSYDKNGNMTGKIGFDEEGKYVSWSYEYDYENRRIRATKMDAEETKAVTFKYDPFGRRIEKRVEELEGGDTRTYAYVYDNEDIILELLIKTEGRKERTETTRYLHGPGIDEPLAVEQKGNLYYYHADGLGSITNLTDAKGRVVQSWEYSSFGIPKHHGNQVKQPYTYTGREWDSETGLYFYRARYYDPVAGRFIAEDPIGFAGGDVNLYGYVLNNPINWIDPSGLAMSDIPGAVSRAISGGANAVADITTNGPPVAKGLLAFAAATETVPLAIAAATSAPVTAAAARIGPYMPAMLDFAEGLLPGPPSTALGVGGTIAKEIAENIWDSINAFDKGSPCP